MSVIIYFKNYKFIQLWVLYTLKDNVFSRQKRLKKNVEILFSKNWTET